jgi:hypothetical protein
MMKNRGDEPIWAIIHIYMEVAQGNSLCSYLFFFFHTRAWTQGLHLEPLHQSYFCEGFFKIGSQRTICPDWLWTAIFLISAPWVARITGVIHQRLALCSYHKQAKMSFFSFAKLENKREEQVLPGPPQGGLPVEVGKRWRKSMGGWI